MAPTSDIKSIQTFINTPDPEMPNSESLVSFTTDGDGVKHYTIKYHFFDNVTELSAANGYDTVGSQTNEINIEFVNSGDTYLIGKTCAVV